MEFAKTALILVMNVTLLNVFPVVSDFIWIHKSVKGVQIFVLHVTQPIACHAKLAII